MTNVLFFPAPAPKIDNSPITASVLRATCLRDKLVSTGSKITYGYNGHVQAEWNMNTISFAEMADVLNVAEKLNGAYLIGDGLCADDMSSTILSLGGKITYGDVGIEVEWPKKRAA